MKIINLQQVDFFLTPRYKCHLHKTSAHYYTYDLCNKMQIIFSDLCFLST